MRRPEHVWLKLSDGREEMERSCDIFTVKVVIDSRPRLPDNHVGGVLNLSLSVHKASDSRQIMLVYDVCPALDLLMELRCDRINLRERTWDGATIYGRWTRSLHPFSDQYVIAMISRYCAFLNAAAKVNSIVVVNLLNILQTAEVQHRCWTSFSVFRPTNANKHME
ncbi:hypothetical protein TcasGA2_TC010729 [Tribolium castaneum]|uniref:Uncharacterized protein n=1 Tax=Tribolium castaneum TaxID=7070 RepID=D7GXW4_TRICA|nr:hypothetical protein TcasGA2_TC010729 [Tribolium castaneum]